MTKITEHTNDFGADIISVEYDDGSAWSGLKSAYDEMQMEHLTENPTEGENN